MKNVKSNITRINEDDLNGMHDGVVTNLAHRSVTGGNPIYSANDSDMPPGVRSLMYNWGGSRGVHTKGTVIDGGTNIYINQRIVDRGGGRFGDGLSFFTSHWKEFAIVAGAAAILVALASLVKKLNQSIKVRYNKCVKTLQRAQKDFTLNEDGLNMAAVMPGVGSRIADWLANMWTGNRGAKKHKTGNIGLYPFCNQYIDEISTDFRCAVDAFNKIALVNEQNGQDDAKGEKKMTSDAETNRVEHDDNSNGNESVSIRYNSFREALSADLINEGYDPKRLNEGILSLVGAGVSLGTLAVKAGSFLIHKKDKDSGETSSKVVNVTKESVREICYAIINNYADKYINMEQVFKQLGVDTNSLADLDKSSCDKLGIILKKYSKPEKNAYTKQYSRIKKAYDKMLEHYYAIGDGIISNFKKYTETPDEKHANLLTASQEKLQNLWDSQKDFYDNNFSHIIIEIISCDAYSQYLNFIVEKVLPVFKSGLAGDADYVLDIMPKKGEYYCLRQTNSQAELTNSDKNDGKVAIAKVLDFNESDNSIKFQLVCAVPPESYEVDEDGIAQIHNNKIDDLDFNAYSTGEDGQTKVVTLKYGKWLALDPKIINGVPTNKYSKRYKRTKKDKDGNIKTEYTCVVTNRESDKDCSNVIYCNVTNNVIQAKVQITVPHKISDEEWHKLATGESDIKELNMGFEETDDEAALTDVQNVVSSTDKATVDAKDDKDLVQIINAAGDLEPKEDKDKGNVAGTSKVYVKYGGDTCEIMISKAYSDAEAMQTEGQVPLNELDDDEKKDDADDKSDDKNTSSEEKSNNEIESGSSDGAKKNMSQAVYCKFTAETNGKSLTEDEIKAAFENAVKNNKLKGVTINFNTPFSVDEFNKKLDGMNYHAYEREDAEEIKNMLGEVKGNVKKESINDLENVIAGLDNEKDGNESDSKVDEMTKKYVEWIKGALSKVSISKNFKLVDKSHACFFKDKKTAIGLLVFQKEAFYSKDGKSSYPFDVRLVLVGKGGSDIDFKNPKETAEVRYVLTVGDKMFKCANNENLEDVVKEIVTNMMGERQVVKDQDYDELSKIILDAKKGVQVANQQNTQQQKPANNQNGGQQGNQPRESVNILYTFDDAVSEGTTTSVRVLGHASCKPQGYYILTECIYEDGFGSHSKLDDPMFVRRLRTRRDVNLFAKSSVNVNVKVLESVNVFNATSTNGLTPNLGTPLYVSTLLLKYDSDDNIVSKISVPKQKLAQ